MEQNIKLAREYVKKHFVKHGMCADICIHDKGDGNPHAHVMLTMRPFNEDSTWGDKQKKVYILDDDSNKIYDPIKRQYKCNKAQTTDWNEHTKTEEWREGWAAAVNYFLKQQGSSERIDHRSYERQGNGLIPTIHMGAAATQLERRGIRTERGNINRQIVDINRELRQLRARLKKVDDEIEKLIADEYAIENRNDDAPAQKSNFAEPLNLITCLTDMLRPENLTRTNKILSLKVVSSAVAYLQQHNITTLPQLQENVESLRNRHKEAKVKFDKTERRLNTLHKHIHHAENHRKYRKVYDEYNQQKPKKQEAFLKAHHEEITLYEAADKYLTAVLNGKPTAPLEAWKAEAGQLTAEKSKLERDVTRLKEDVRQVEIIKGSVTYILDRASVNEKSTTRTRGKDR